MQNLCKAQGLGVHSVGVLTMHEISHHTQLPCPPQKNPPKNIKADCLLISK
jgi:hypothetical protein